VVNNTPRPHFTTGKDSVQEAVWGPGPVWTCAENLAPTGFRSPERPACRNSLYRLSYHWRYNAYLKLGHGRFLGAFARLRKATISFAMSVRPSVPMEQLGSYWMDIREILYVSAFRKTVDNIRVSRKSDKKNGYFT
jgi:hypothetical protein